MYTCIYMHTFWATDSMISGSLAGRDLQIKASYASSPICVCVCDVCRYMRIYACTFTQYNICITYICTYR